MKSLYIFSFLFIIVAFSACDEQSGNKSVSLLGVDTTKVNPNSMAYVYDNKRENESKSENKKSKEKKKVNDKDKVKVSQIEADTKIKIAKIRSNSQMHIAKVQAQAQQEIAKSDSITRIKTSQLEISTKKETLQYTVYIVIAIVVFLIIALILLYLNAKKNRDLQRELQEAQFVHDRDLREKEFEERRIHKILDMVSKGKLPASVQKEVILSIASPKAKVIENREISI